MRHADLTKIDGTIGKIFCKNRDSLLNESKTIEDLRLKVSTLFTDNKLNTPKSRMIEFKLKSMSFTQGLLYIQNIIFKSANMNVR
jgi:hypothetical protein